MELFYLLMIKSFYTIKVFRWQKNTTFLKEMPNEVSTYILTEDYKGIFKEVSWNMITGKKAEAFTAYDMEMTVDERHKHDNGAVSYLWINEKGEIMETPIIYPGDKVSFGTREGFWIFFIIKIFL